MRKLIAAALIAGAVAAPSTVMAHGPERGKADTPAKPAKPAKPVKHVKKMPVVNMVFMGVVAEDATAESVALKGLDGVNRHAERVLGSSTELTLSLAKTRLSGKILKEDGTVGMGRETFAQLKAGDRVFFVVRARKGTALAELPAAKWMKDFTYNAPVVEPAPVDPGTGTPPPPPPPPPGDGGTVITPL